MTQLMRTDARQRFINAAINVSQRGCVFDENGFWKIDAVHRHFFKVIDMESVCRQRSGWAQLQQLNSFGRRARLRPFLRLIDLLGSNGLNVKMQPCWRPDTIDFCQDSIEVSFCEGCLNRW